MASVAAERIPEVAVYEGEALKRRLREVERKRRLKAFSLVLPLFLFILVSFVLPIIYMLRNAVYDPDIHDLMPLTAAALQDWNGQDIPDEPAFAALVADLTAAQANRDTAQIGKRLNYEISGIRSKILASARKIEKLEAGPYKDQVIAIDKIWGERETWAVIKRNGSRFTPFYLLQVLDLEQNADGDIVGVAPERRVYVDVLIRTMSISLTVTLMTLLLGYPLAYLLANMPTRFANLLMILVLLPFWTSLLVRTTAWFVLLQDNGAVNSAIMSLGLSEEPLKLIFSRAGTIIAMTHIQLPFTLLPIYSVMKGIPPAYMRAARSLGAGPVYAFRRIYMPQTLPGIAAGCLLTFILCLGYYITPALVGGPSDQMISGLIAEAMNRESNWGKASAMGAILLSATMVLFFIYNRLVGIDKVKLG